MEKLLSLKNITPRDDETIDTVVASHRWGDDKGRAFKILYEAQRVWDYMSRFRKERERNKRYNYGDQWGDHVYDVDDGKWKTEEQYIMDQGSVPLKNNIIRRNVKTVKGVQRNLAKEPSCTARDRSEQQLGEVMSTVLQYVRDINEMGEINSNALEEYLISGLTVQRKSFGWRNEMWGCWTDNIRTHDFFIDTAMRDPRGWDCSILGEVHDVTFGQLCSQFATTPEEWIKLRDIYNCAADKGFLTDYTNQRAHEFGFSQRSSYDFLFTSQPGRCRVIEVWRKEQKPRFRCHDYNSGEIFKCELEEKGELVDKVNQQRMQTGLMMGMAKDDIPLIEAEWFVDDYWYFYYLSPFGDILKEGETPYEHKSHPYAFKMYPFVDGEIHSYVGDVIDQQRFINRLITMYDWVLRASAKGVLMFPEYALPDGYSMDDIAQEWARYNGVIVFKAKPGMPLPQQITNNCTNIGITELLNVQLKLMEDISGVNSALQGKSEYAGMSASMFNQQTQNATIALLDILESFSSFIIQGARKDVKNIQQFYDKKMVEDITGEEVDFDQLQNVDFDLTISESQATPANRATANEILLQLYRDKAITVEMMLENGYFPFADKLLQSLKTQREMLDQGQMPEGIPPELMQQAQQGANMDAVNRLTSLRAA